MKTSDRTRSASVAGIALSRRQRVLLVAAATVFALSAGCATNRTSAEPRLTAEQRELNVQSFDVVWETVRDKHYDPELGGLDWQAVRDELRPKVARAQTMSVARGWMQTAVRRLQQSHFGVIPVDVYRDIDAPGEQSVERDGETGMAVRVIGGKALVTAVRPGSPAELAGVKSGWQIVRVAGEDIEPAIEKITSAYDQSTMQQYMLAAAVAARVSGPVGEPVTMEFVGEGDVWVTLEIPRAAPEGQRAVFGHLPPLHVWFDARRVDGDVGYIAFNMFFDPARVMKKFEEAIGSFRNTAGVVIDLRGNPGGIGAMSMGIAGWFIDRADQPLGTMRTRQMEINFAIFPRPETYTAPLAILVDGCTASTAEILAGGLQDLGRARVFGTRSAGAALPSNIVRLPNGDGFQYALGDYISVSGRRLEAAGVIPDVEVVPTREQLLAGHDPVLDAAVAWIRSQK